MKRMLVLSLLLIGAGTSYGQAIQTSSINVSSVDTSNVNPAYADSVKQLKEAVPVIISSARILVPKLTNLAQQTASGGVTGFIQGTITLVADGATRDAIISLTKVVIATIGTTIKLTNADPSTKKTVKSLLAAVSQDPAVAKVISLSEKVPFVGKELHDKLLELIGKTQTL